MYLFDFLDFSPSNTFNRRNYRSELKDGKVILTVDVPGYSKEDVVLRRNKRQETLTLELGDEKMVFRIGKTDKVDANVKNGQLSVIMHPSTDDVETVEVN